MSMSAIQIEPVKNEVEKSLSAHFDQIFTGSYRKKAFSPKLIQGIDDFCQQIAQKIGEAIFDTDNASIKYSLQNRIGWITGQYRGTAMSGKREFKDIVVNPSIASGPQNHVLLSFYWNLYGLGATMGEVFYSRLESFLSSQRSNGHAPSASKLQWFSMVVRLHPADSLFVHQDLHSNQGFPLSIQVPQKWVEELLPDSLFKKIKRRVEFISRRSITETQQLVLKDLKERCFRTTLERRLESLGARILAERHPSNHMQPCESLRNIREYFGYPHENSSDHSDKILIRRLLRAIQGLSLFWRWIAASAAEQKLPYTTGPLLLLQPVAAPNNDRHQEIPRAGLSIMFLENQTETSGQDEIRKFTQLLDETLISKFERAGKYLSDHGKHKEDDLDKACEQLKLKSEDGVKPKDALVRELTESRQLSKAEATLLLLRALNAVTRIATLVPTLVHEGTRFGVDILLGMHYHEQVLGAKLASPAFSFGLEDIDDADSGMASFLTLKSIINSSYSFLDDPGIVIFGTLDSSNDQNILWSSILKVREQENYVRSVKGYETLTSTHRGLFAISIGKDLKLRLFGGGKLLLEYWSNKWHLGAGTKLLNDKLTGLVARLGNTEPSGLNNSMSGFSNLVQSISEIPGAGALFVITPSKKIVKSLYHISEPPDELWKTKTLDSLLTETDQTLLKLATMDGATVIDLSKSRTTDFIQRWKSASVLPRRLIAERFDLTLFQDKANDDDLLIPWSETLSYGSKRASALALVMQARVRKEKCVCVVISADGPIYLMSSVGDECLVRLPE